MKTVNKSIKNASKSDQAITSKVYRCRKKLLELNAPHDDGCIWTAYDCYSYFYNKPYSDNEKYSDGETYGNDWMNHKSAVSWYKFDCKYKHQEEYNMSFRLTYDDELLAEFGHELVEDIEAWENYKINLIYIKPLDSVIKKVAEEHGNYLQEGRHDGRGSHLILPTRSQYQREK